MSKRRGIRRLFHLGLRRKDVVVRETEEEIAAHLALRAEQLEREGWTPGQARAEARRRFGATETARRDLVRAALRRRDRVALRERLDAWRQDLRHAWRLVVAEPGFTAVVVVVIALGVGANAAMFGVIDRLLLKGPEDVRETDRLTRISYSTTVPGEGRIADNTFGYVTYTTLRDNARGFEGVTAYSETPAVFGEGERAEPIEAGHATWDFFPLLGVRPALGRFFGAAEDRPGAAQRVVVLGHRLWNRRFGGDSSVLGRTVAIGGEPYTVIGVALRGFTGVELRRVDAWMPMSLRHPRPDWPTTWQAQWLKIVARLAPGVTAADASTEATRAFRRSYTGDREPLKHLELAANPLWYDDAGEEPLEVAVSRWLIGVSLVVLLIACANVTNLLLARAVRRRREVGVRLALGISRARLVRMLLAESLVLALLGGAAALLVVPLIGRLVRATLLPSVQWTDAPVDGRVLAVAGALALLTGIVTGLVPALQAGRRDIVGALRCGVRESGVRVARTRSLLAMAQAAFSVLLLVGAGLFVRSLQRARSVDLGIQPNRVLVASGSWPEVPLSDMTPAQREERGARRQAFYQAALARVRRMPEAEHAAVAVGTPFHSSFQVRLSVPGRDSLPRVPGGGPYVQAISPDYFATVGLALRGGRAFGPGDHDGSEPVTIVNATMAHALWPDGDAIGHCMEIGEDPHSPCFRIVGIVEDAHRFQLRERPAMQYYIPLGQERDFGGSRLLVRPRGDVEAMTVPLRRALYAVDPRLLYANVETLESALDPQFRPWRLGATLISAFGLLALLIAAVGLYSLIAYLVASRTHEVAVRMALGARRHDVVGMVLRHGISLAGMGLGAGVVMAFAAAPHLRDLLFRQSSRDPVVYLAAVGVLLVAAVVASVVPARRATRVNPMTALKSD
jgi:predicted permease